MDSNDMAPIEVLPGGGETCDHGTCTNPPTNNYKGDCLCDQHFQQYMAMQLD